MNLTIIDLIFVSFYRYLLYIFIFPTITNFPFILTSTIILQLSNLNLLMFLHVCFTYFKHDLHVTTFATLFIFLVTNSLNPVYYLVSFFPPLIHSFFKPILYSKFLIFLANFIIHLIFSPC